MKKEKSYNAKVFIFQSQALDVWYSGCLSVFPFAYTYENETLSLLINKTIVMSRDYNCQRSQRIIITKRRQQRPFGCLFWFCLVQDNKQNPILKICCMYSRPITIAFRNISYCVIYYLLSLNGNECTQN